LMPRLQRLKDEAQTGGGQCQRRRNLRSADDNVVILFAAATFASGFADQSLFSILLFNSAIRIRLLLYCLHYNTVFSLLEALG
jgi:hypothetical protein